MKKITIFTIVAFMLTVIGLGISISYVYSLSRKNNIYRQNIIALTDTIKTQRSKAGDYVYSILAYQSKIKDLEVYSKELKETLDDYKKTTGNQAQSAVRVVTQIVTPPSDTIYTVNPLEFSESFDFSDAYHTLAGTVTGKDSLVSVHIDEQIVKADFTAGLDNLNRVFIKTNNPYVQVQSLQGFTVPKQKKSRWGIGIHAGAGVQLNKHGFTLGPQLGVSLNYNVIAF